MAKRRPSGDGMVRRRKDGRWEGRIVIGHKEDGASIFRYVSARTQKELLRKLHLDMEVYLDADLSERSNMPLGEWLDHWLDEYAAPALRPNTLRSYRHHVETHLKPQLGSIPVRKLTGTDVQKLYQSLSENGRQKEHPQYGHQLAPSTIRRIHNILHGAMEAAVQERLTAQNPTDGVTLPKIQKPPKHILNDAQLERFLDVIREDTLWHDFFYTELTTSLRRGEICGLMWNDFDELHGTLSVRRTISAQKGGRLTAGETKTGTGRRTITLSPSTVQLLVERRKRSYSEWIFPNPTQPELPMRPASAYTRLKALLKQTGLPSIRFHDLRHTFATHALASGVDAKTLSGILGHTQASFTLDTYTHVTGDMQERASQIVGGFMDEIAVR